MTESGQAKAGEGRRMQEKARTSGSKQKNAGEAF